MAEPYYRRCRPRGSIFHEAPQSRKILFYTQAHSSRHETSGPFSPSYSLATKEQLVAMILADTIHMLIVLQLLHLLLLLQGVVVVVVVVEADAEEGRQ